MVDTLRAIWRSYQEEYKALAGPGVELYHNEENILNALVFHICGVLQLMEESLNSIREGEEKERGMRRKMGLE